VDGDHGCGRGLYRRVVRKLESFSSAAVNELLFLRTEQHLGFVAGKPLGHAENAIGIIDSPRELAYAS
jgi:hypothetical protein